MTEPERKATEHMRRETANMHPAGKVPGHSTTEPVHGQPKPETEASGTRVIPMPGDASEVAGMPRATRVHSEPGDPGNPAPENQQAGVGSEVKPKQ